MKLGPNTSTVPVGAPPLCRSQCGSIYVEFAIVLPFLILSALLIYGSSTLLGSISFLIPTAYESLLVGSGEKGTVGVSRMNTVSDTFETVLENDLVGYSFTPAYTTKTDLSGDEVPLVEVELLSGFQSIDFFSGWVLDLSLVGPQVARDLANVSTSFATEGGPYDCDGMVCSGASCPSSPCT